MRVFILHGSARKNGVTGALAEEFARGAKEAGHEVTKIELKEQTINDCLGCGACQMNGGNCVQKDDMTAIYQEILSSDVIVLASPVYYYTWTSMMKRVLDRTFALQSSLANKTFYLLSSGAAPDEQYMQTMFDSYHLYISCFAKQGNKDGGYVMACGMNAPADVTGTKYLKDAYELGKNLA